MGKAYRIPSALDRLRKQQMQIKEVQALNRNRNTPRPVASTAFAGVSAGSSQGGTGNFLRPTGDTMIGPLALAPPVDFRVDIDGNNTINIGESSSQSQYSSNIQLDDTTTSDLLDIIEGAAFDGQILIIRTFAPTNLTKTIRQATLANGGNIQTPNDADFNMGDLQMISLIFDESLVVFANTGGTWRVLTGDATGGGGITFPIDFPITFLGTIAGPIQDIDFSLSTRHGWKAEFSANITLTFSNPPTGELGLATFKFKQDGTGGHTLTLPVGTINKDIVEAGFLLGIDEETGIVIEFFDDTFYAFLETGNVVTGGGTGDVVGPASATDNAIARFDGTTGKLIQNSGILISDTDAITGVTGISGTGTGVVISGIDTYDFFQAGQSIQNKADSDGGILYNVNDIQSHIFRADSVEIARFAESAAGVYRLEMLDHSIRDAQDITFDNASGAIIFAGSSPAIGFDSVAARLLINMPTGGNLFVTNNNVIGSTQINDNSIAANIISPNDVLQLGVDATVPTVEGEFRNSGSTTLVFANGAVRDLSNIPTTLSANVNLSNLVSPTSINQNLIPQAAITLGDSGNPWSNLTSNKISLGTAGTFAASDNAIIADAATGMEYNTPVGDLHSFFFGNVKRIEFNTSELKFVSGGQFEGAGFILTDAGFPPVATGELRRDGDAVIWEAPIFQIQRNTTGSLFTQFNLVKVDAAPSSGEPIADINFQLFDSPTTITYAQIHAEMENVTDSGQLDLNVRADSALTSAMRIIGRSGSVRYDIDFRNETILKASSGNMGFFVTDEPDNLDNLGTSGTLQIPRFGDGDPSVNDLNSAFGAFDGAFGFDTVDATGNNKRLYVRFSATEWMFFNESGSIT